MRHPAFSALLALALLLGAAVVPAAGVATGAVASSDGAATSGPTASTGSAATAVRAPALTDGAARPAVDFESAPSTEFHVVLQPDRDAAWTVTVTYRLRNANETETFRRVAERFREEEVGPGADLYRNYAAGASEYAGREMSITNVERAASVDEEPAVDDESVVAVGTLELSFVWTAFLEANGDQLVMDDAFRTADGESWLRSLGPNQRMVIRTPEGYAVSSTPGVSVDFEENAVVIEGPRSFGSEERIGVVYSSNVADAPPWGLLAGAVVLAAAIISGGLYAYRRREPGAGAGDGTGEGPAAESGASGPSAETERSSEPPEPAGGEEEPEKPTEDLSLLSDEERVERLLDRNGGRMRQADVVEETGWSDAKVSQLLSAMAEEGRIEKLRLGRENLISLPENDPRGEDADDEA
ncbi:hypothetical protein GCM10027435_11520 [Haloparvum alkalitolerans]|uniref:helix-turn-helix transcriptional regulator n=1 Tax=Haloparvum alkalitolerans TaxID=1042953 RepID=UPI003CF8F8BA